MDDGRKKKLINL